MRKNFSSKRRAIFALGLALAAVASISAAPGDLDVTFNGTGAARIGFGFGADSGNAVAVQADGKYLVAGSSSNGGDSDFSVVRYKADGTLDTSFGVGGKALMHIGPGNDVAKGVRIQTDGRIVVAGYTTRDTGFLEIAVVRYHTDGSLDPTFGGDGIVTTAIIGANDVGNAVAIQADGKIVVAGYSYTGVSDIVAVVRYHPDGSLDTSFDGDGKALAPIGDDVPLDDDRGRAVEIQADGKIVVAGDHRRLFGFCVVRYHPNGSLDTSFDGDGIATQRDSGPGGDQCNALFIQPDGKIVTAGRDQLSTNPNFGSHFLIIRFNADGSRDTSIGGAGRVYTEITPPNPGYPTNAEALAVGLQLGDGFSPAKIIAAGYCTTGSVNKEFAAVRYHLDGSLDTSFDTDGILITPIGTGEDRGNAMVIQGTGTEPRKIVMVGSGVASVSSDFAFIRCLENGSLDTTFDSDGKRTDDIGHNLASANSVAIQTDGRIVIAGSTNRVGPLRDVAVTRHNADGTLDQSFDGDGKAITSLSPDGDEANAVAIQADGKIVVAGYRFGITNTDFAVVRYTTNGSPDASFDTDGRVFTAVGSGNDVGHGVAIQTDGKIVVAGSTVSAGNSDLGIVRYLANGSLDTSFNGTGKVITPIGAGNDEGYAVAIQADGKIVVAGSTANGTNTDLALVRYHPNGALDTSFHFDGKATTPVGTGNDAGYALAIQADGKILATGSSFNGANEDLVVVRYLSNGTLDNSFDGEGILTTPIGTGDDVGNGVVVQADGKILVAGAAGSATTGDYATVRFHSNGSLDNSYGNNGKVLVAVSGGNDSGHGVTLDANGRVVVVGEAGGLFGVVRLLGDNPSVPLLGAVSIKAHGEAQFAIDLPLAGNPGIESRSGGVNGDHVIVFTFANPLTSVGGANVTSGVGSVSSSAIGNPDARQYVVHLTGVSNAQVITLRLTNVNDAAGNSSSSLPISMGVLLGDTNGDRFVNAGDALQTRSRSGQTTGALNFRSDVNIDGLLNSGDTAAVRARSGTALP